MPERGSERLAQGRLEAAHLRALADCVDRLHRQAPTARPGTPAGDSQVSQARLASLPQGLAEAAPAASAEACRSVERWLRSQAAHWLPRMRERLASGHVRQCDGDLRLERVALQGDQAGLLGGKAPVALQGWCDVLGDASGIVVDLLAHGRRDLAFVFLNRYLELSGDYGGLDLLRFYLVQRAAARALVLASGSQASDPEGNGAVGHREHLSLALRLVHGADPRLLITFGPPGSGKSFAARLLSARTGAILLTWQIEHERLFGQADAAARRAPGKSTPSGPCHSRLVQDRLRQLAGTALAAGFPTILDGSFPYHWQRDNLQGLAATLGVPFTILDCQTRDPGRAQIGQPGRHDRHDGTDVEGGEDSDSDALGERERLWSVAFGPGEPLSPATLAAHWLRERPRAMPLHTPRSIRH